MTDRALDDLARRVLLDAIRLEYHDLIEELPEHDFSPSFEKKMQKLIRRANHPIRHRIVQAAACLLLAVLLSGCSVLAFSPQARAAFTGWIKELQQEWFSYHYTGEIEEGPRNTVYYPAWLPDGYRETMSAQPGTFVHSLYQNKGGSLLSFSYQAGLEKTEFHVAWENTEIQQVTVAGSPADLYLNTAGDTNVLVWTDETSGIVFWIAAQLREDEMIRMAESIQESESLGWVFRPTWFPIGTYIVTSEESEGEGNTLFETDEGTPIEFSYSKSGSTPYANRTDGQSITIGASAAMLYPSEQGDSGHVLTWSDTNTGYAFWLVSDIPCEDMIRIAESVDIYQYDMNGIFEIETFDPEVDSICEKVEQSLTDEFVTQIKECAKTDAESDVYMQSEYTQMIQAYMTERISPERDSATARISDLMVDFTSDDKLGSHHILCLIEPFYFADVYVGYHNVTANIYDECGTMIAGYNSEIGQSGPWTAVPTFEEMQFQHIAAQIYATAYQEAKAHLISKD